MGKVLMWMKRVVGMGDPLTSDPVKYELERRQAVVARKLAIPPDQLADYGRADKLLAPKR